MTEGSCGLSHHQGAWKVSSVPVRCVRSVPTRAGSSRTFTNRTFWSSLCGSLGVWTVGGGAVAAQCTSHCMWVRARPDPDGGGRGGAGRGTGGGTLGAAVPTFCFSSLPLTPAGVATCLWLPVGSDCKQRACCWPCGLCVHVSRWSSLLFPCLDGAASGVMNVRASSAFLGPRTQGSSDY